jgi:serine/threonine protein kinase
MPAPASVSELLELARKSGVVETPRLEAYLNAARGNGNLPAEPAKLAAQFVRDGVLTHFQAEQLMQGKWRRFTIGKYKVLERLGSGGMGSVFLCEHKFMRRRVAVKVLPTAKAADPSSLERFYREAKASGAVKHPNIVHAYDIDQDENLHFLVMEYVDGASLQEIVKKSGPLSVERACHYMSQAAAALDHASRAGLVHRDIKPGNILVDRHGVVKILDMGLARFFNDDEDMLTRKYDENVLGTADYLAPEQADDSHTVDVRADIYSLGGTFYFVLTGRTPFGEGSVPQKLMWHRTRQPKPINAYRADMPAEVQAVLDKMMAKEPGQRYQQPEEICAALAPWTQAPIAPPSESEMPQLCPAISGSATPAPSSSAPLVGPGSLTGRKPWQVAGAQPTSAPATTPRPSRSPAAAETPTIKTANTPPAARATTTSGRPAGGPAGKAREQKPDAARRSVRGPTPAHGSARPQPKPAKAPARPSRRFWQGHGRAMLIAAIVTGAALGLVALLALAYYIGLFGK